MTWFKVDDAFAFHPKAITAGNAALGLWVRAGAWCSGNLTDGALPRHMIGTLGAQKRNADRLVESGLWVETEEGYQFVDWEDWQPSKEQVKAEREAAKARQKAWRERKRNAVTNPVTNAVSNAAPTRPDPSSSSKEEEKTSSSKAAPKRATQIPDSLEVTEAMRVWATANSIGLDLARETAKFADFHRAKGSTFKDWEAAWRTWMRKAVEYSGNVRALPGARPGGPRYTDEVIQPRSAFSAVVDR